jgi:ubiquitin-conjugating enzyme E2 J2
VLSQLIVSFIVLNICNKYCTPSPSDLPNMGETRNEKPPEPSRKTQSSSSPASSQTVQQQPVMQPTTVAQSSTNDGNKSKEGGSETGGGWVELLWQKWRWGLFIAIAVVVSRLSSSA